MLAIKLTKNNRVKFRKGDIIIPVPNWEYTKIFLRKYLVELNRKARKYKEDIPYYMTLFKIPDECPVCQIPHTLFAINNNVIWYKKYTTLDFYTEWNENYMKDPEECKYIGIYEIKFKLVKEYREFFSDFFDDEKEDATISLFILGEDLNPSCIKWTKNISTLYGISKKLRNK